MDQPVEEHAQHIRGSEGHSTGDEPPRAIEVTGVGVEFASRRRRLHAIDRVDFSCPAGSFVTVIGPSGCGKSTLLRLLAGLGRPTSGELRLFGRPPEELVREHQLGVAFQASALLPWLSVRTNILLPFRIAGRRPDTAWVDELIRLVGLTGFDDALPRELSGGMRQRVSIARAFALRPRAVLLDEPFGALDAVTRRRLNLELQRWWSDLGVTTVLVTHDVTEATLLSDRVIVLSGRPARVVADVDVPFPRPRDLGVLRTSEFHEFTENLIAMLG